MKSGKHCLFTSLSVAILITAPATAQKKYDVGASDSEIKIGNMAPYSGPLSAHSVAAKTEAAYFNKINAEGGIHGRKIKFISYDDAYNPAKGVEQGRKLVESDEVLLIFQSLGVGAYAIRKYLNDRKIPGQSRALEHSATFPDTAGGGSAGWYF